ncbi:hypothetical protein [Desulfopila sp. IMCC35008]|uniref:hypothetical protein n=1 Tax=Desulfopila sp. IMCC35008 TaxID=2653858 RepID=UPI0013D6615E|nr:hypothetical protein [Desulfopila sp. IMCC35008]
MRVTINVVITFMALVLFMAVSTVVSGGEMTDLVFIFESTDSSTAGGKIITSYVGKHKTVVQSPDSLLIIDYEQLKLVEYHASTGRCDTYPLVDERTNAKAFSPEERFRQEMVLKLGTAEVVTKNGFMDTEGFREVVIFWGRLVNLHRTVVPPSVRIYGRCFTAGRDHYWIDDKYEDLDVLLDYGKRRDSVLGLNPLLRRLDISGLVLLLNGVPVQKKDEQGVVEKFETIKTGSVDSCPRLPAACR